MKKEYFNNEWKIKTGIKGPFEGMMPSTDTEKTVILPHDAMVYEERDPEVSSGKQTGFYPAKDYTYTKEFIVPEEWKEKFVVLEFEGVAQHALVYINDELAGQHLNPYLGFYINTEGMLKYGAKNTIKVIATSDDLNSRWYPGSGVYRNVMLHIGDRLHITQDGVRITTEEIEEDLAVVRADILLKHAGTDKKKIEIQTEISTEEGLCGKESTWVTLKGGKEYKIMQRLQVESPKLWDTEHPDLYTVTISIYENNKLMDVAEEVIGIRKVSIDSKHGLRINGKRVLLRGACIHHVNGIIGACTLEKAEEFRCRKLKEAGFNSIRSAHHPISKAMLAACDRLGMLVMDELSDIWQQPKNAHDYARYFTENWDKDIENMVRKDFNHPSVIMYSIGNEIPDIGRESGWEWNRILANKVKELDSSRYTTNGINGFLLLGKDLGIAVADFMGLTPEQMATAATSGAAENILKGSENGIDEMNHLMGGIPPEIWYAICNNTLTDERLKEISGALDVTGLNYMENRYEKDCLNYPNRIVVGSETYPFDIVKNWSLVEKNPNIIGDFSWTGYDYLGEAGIGSYIYTEDGAEPGASNWPARTADCGDINLIGYRRPMSYLREIVYGLRKAPYIAVERMNRYGKELYRTPWAYTKDVVESYTWHGYEGQKTSVDVFSADEEVELFINGKSQGRKEAGKEHEYTASWNIIYEPGELMAVGYQNGKETERTILKTADKKVELCIESDTRILKADGKDLAFLTVKLVDGEGNENQQEKKKISVRIEGPGVLQGYGSACPSSIGSYQDTEWETYDGYVMAVVRSGFEQGTIKVVFSANGCNDQSLDIEVG
ncbi:glycoside hydrolase family 2 protein [Clostridium diolis]|uniref:glycoside hydrolase family 2 protein n=1 Tax=Clostridium diolis TaxID=223919 RepID=UPI003AF607DF